MNLAINRKHLLATCRERSFLSRVPQSCNFLRTGKCLLLQHHLNLPAYLLRFQPWGQKREKGRKEVFCRILNKSSSTVAGKSNSRENFQRWTSKNQDPVLHHLDFSRNTYPEAFSMETGHTERWVSKQCRSIWIIIFQGNITYKMSITISLA